MNNSPVDNICEWPVSRIQGVYQQTLQLYRNTCEIMAIRSQTNTKSAVDLPAIKVSAQTILLCIDMEVARRAKLN